MVYSHFCYLTLTHNPQFSNDSTHGFTTQAFLISSLVLHLHIVTSFSGASVASHTEQRCVILSALCVCVLLHFNEELHGSSRHLVEAAIIFLAVIANLASVAYKISVGEGLDCGRQ